MKGLRNFVALFFLLVALPWSGVCVAGAFDDGVAAYDQGHFDVAFKLWLPLAEQGDLAAQFNLAALYEKGTGVAQDSAQAAHWYLEAAKQGDADAELKIADLYAAGTGVAKDPAEARKWYNALIANPHHDKGALVLKQQARVRLANAMNVTQEIIPYEGGRFVLVRSPSGSCVIALQGPITRDTRFKFDDVVERSARIGCVKPTLMLESPGGLLLDGIRLGEEVRRQAFRTVTRYECASSCALIFMGGVERTLVGSRAAIGLHQSATFAEQGNNKHCGNDVQRDGALAMRHYLVQVLPETSDKVEDVVMQTPCTSITWINGQRALDLGVATKVESPTTDLFGPKAAR